MSISGIEKAALRLSAMRLLKKHGISYNPPIREPRLVLRHIDGPYLSRLDGGLHWLTWRERLMVWLGRWDAWDIEQRVAPLFEGDAQ